MRWDYGKIYKEIRKSKGLTQEEICGDFLARSTLARIESGQVVPKFDTMIFLLRQIDMTPEEFKYICDYYQPSQRQKILNSLYNQGETIVGTKGLLQLKRECEAYLYKHSDIPIKHALDSINITIHLRQNGISETKEINATTNKIWAYLEKQDTWYESDFRLLSTILYFFPLENIKQFTQKILNSIKKYQSFRYGNNLHIGLLVNLSTIYLYNGLKRECADITKYIYDLSKKEKRYDSLGLSQIRLGICKNDNELIKKGIALLQLTDEKELVKSLKEEIEKYR